MLRRSVLSIAALAALTLGLVATSIDSPEQWLAYGTADLDDPGLFLADEVASDDTDAPAESLLRAAAWQIDATGPLEVLDGEPFNVIHLSFASADSPALNVLVTDCEDQVLVDSPDVLPGPEVIVFQPEWSHELLLDEVPWDCDDDRCGVRLCLTLSEREAGTAELAASIELGSREYDSDKASVSAAQAPEVTIELTRLPDPDPR